MAKKPHVKPVVELPPATPALSRRTCILLLLAILAAAAALRMTDLSHSPPGMSQDEGQNIWDAWSMLKTGMDQVGDRWPIFYSKCFGGNRSTLQLYYLIPFEAIGGLGVEVGRFSSAFSGVLAVLLAYFVGARLFGRSAGLLAAAIMAFNPWHIQQSRWAHEATLVPTLILGPLALMLLANFPLDDSENRRPRPLVAVAAGLAAGVACYGYPVVRLFLPLMLILLAVVLWRPLWAMLKTRRGAAAIVGFALAMAVTFGPLVYKHITDPGAMNKRGVSTKIWNESDSLGEKISKVAARYPAHFGLDFLFIQGDRYALQSPPNNGMFHWYSLPLMLLGAGFLVSRLRKSRAARVLLVWLLVYPIPDCITQHIVGTPEGAENSLHALRTLPGLAALVLLAGLGASAGGLWLWRKKRAALYAAAAVLVLAAAVINVRYLTVFYGEFNRRPYIYHAFQTDLLEASKDLRGKLDNYDGVYFTMQQPGRGLPSFNEPFLVSLVGLDYDPARWFQDEHVIATAEVDKYKAFKQAQIIPSSGEWDLHLQFGRVVYMYGNVSYDSRTGREFFTPFFPPPKGRILYVIRPVELRQDRGTLGEVDRQALSRNIVGEIKRPDGTIVLLMCEANIPR